MFIWRGRGPGYRHSPKKAVSTCYVSQGKLYRFPCGGRLIDGQDHLQSVSPRYGVHIGRAVLLNCLDHIGKEAGVAIAIYIAGGLLQSPVFFICFICICKVPHIDIIGGGASELYCPGFAKEIQRLLQVFGVDIGSALNGTNRPIFKFHHRHADIFALQIIVELLTCDAVDLIYLVSHHPAQQVDAVDALIHKAATILRPGAPPRGLVVIVPVPVHRTWTEPWEICPKRPSSRAFRVCRTATLKRF